MSDNRIPVFDDWGRKVGEFIPEGGGCETMVVAFFAILILWVFGYVIYLVYRLITDAIRDAKKGKWMKATVILTIMSILILFTGIALIISSSTASAQKAQENITIEATKAAQNTIATENENIPNEVQITKIRENLNCQTANQILGWMECTADKRRYTEYQVSNKSRYTTVTLYGHNNDTSTYICMIYTSDGVPGIKVEPLQTKTFVCGRETSIRKDVPCISQITIETETSSTTWCLNSKSGEFHTND